MRRENAGCVTCRSWAERLKFLVSTREMKSSSHLVSMLSPALLNRRGIVPPGRDPESGRMRTRLRLARHRFVSAAAGARTGR
jgi:hypothetical protein